MSDRNIIRAYGFKLINNLCFGQVKVSDKSNEITAIPALLKILDIEGATITTDAMGCQSINGIIVVDSTRQEKGKHESNERRYYITSHKDKEANFMAHAIRSHWHVENKLHML